jgi:hypothetical protein
MFLKVSLVIFLLLGTATKYWSAAAENLELANIHLQTVPIHYIADEDQNFTFGLAIGGFDRRFSVRTSLEWENLTLDRVNETIVLNPSVYGPAFDDFCRLLTDGDNMYVETSLRNEKAIYTGVDIMDMGCSVVGRLSCYLDSEQALFGNQMGCVNGVDLQGNYIDSIALTITDFESVYHDHPTHDGEWNTGMNLSLMFRGRPLLPHELDLAVVRPRGRISGYTDNNLTTMYFSAVHGSRWATLEYMIDWSTAVVGQPISYVREFGTHNIRELITDGDNGDLKVGFQISQVSRAYPESSFFEGQPGCFNSVDLKGNNVQDISLVLEEGSECTVWANGTDACTIVPKFVFSGSLGFGPTVCLDCECESECEDYCNDGLPKHTIATTVEILALVTGWAWFLM